MDTPFLLFLEGIGGTEMILIMVVILVFFGPSKIPELARGLGKGIREFKDASREIRSEFEQAGNTPAPQKAPYVQPNQHVSPDADVHPTVAVAPIAIEPEALPAVTPPLPPNLAPEGTQPRQPYIPASPDA